MTAATNAAGLQTQQPVCDIFAIPPLPILTSMIEAPTSDADEPSWWRVSRLRLLWMWVLGALLLNGKLLFAWDD